ncbi:hypothetical protein ACLB2K_040187 [Fragaria x ananassa]
MRARTFYDLDQEEKWKVWNVKSERYKDWKYQCHKAYMKEGPFGMPLDFIGREDRWEFLCSHSESDEFKRLSLENKQNRGEKIMHHHTRSWRNSEYKGSNFQLSKVLRRTMSGPIMKLRQSIIPSQSFIPLDLSSIPPFFLCRLLPSFPPKFFLISALRHRTPILQVSNLSSPLLSV